MWLIAVLFCGGLIGHAADSFAAGFAAILAFLILDGMVEEVCERMEKAINALGETEDEDEP